MQLKPFTTLLKQKAEGGPTDPTYSQYIPAQYTLPYCVNTLFITQSYGRLREGLCGVPAASGIDPSTVSVAGREVGCLVPVCYIVVVFK